MSMSSKTVTLVATPTEPITPTTLDHSHHHVTV